MSTVLRNISDFLGGLRDQGVATDLIGRWHPGMETKVLVSGVGGTPVEGRPGSYTDGNSTWSNILIPTNGDCAPMDNCDGCEWSMDDHASAMGSTGWDWQARTSRWVAFDFDALIGHAKGIGITDEELEEISRKITTLPYVEVRRSTGGKGLHLYVLLEVPTENHIAHAGLARCVLSMISTDTGFDIAPRNDCCGGNMWIWRSDLEAGGLGLSLVKASTLTLGESDLPANWREHIEVIANNSGKIAIKKEIADFASKIKGVALDDEHRRLVQLITQNDSNSGWLSDYHCLRTSTGALQHVFDAGGVKGVFRTTDSTSFELNCYSFPITNGAWKVYRFDCTNESDTWGRDCDSRASCFYNRPPTLTSAAFHYGGVEDPQTNEFVFFDANAVIDTVHCLGESLVLPDEAYDREIRLGKSKDGRLTVKFTRRPKEPSIAGWVSKGRNYCRVLKTPFAERDESMSEYDDVFRKLASVDGKDAGWALRNETGWTDCPKDDIKCRLESLGAIKSSIGALLGHALYKPWKLVNLPFQDEYPHGRQWNWDSAQLSVEPADIDGPHTHWNLILNHVGEDLNKAIAACDACQEDGIFTGADYLKAWIACMFRCPFEPLPYLFFFGKQNSGKSIFHEAISLLMTKGYVNADRALTNSNDFNGELSNAILCVVEEKNIAKSPGAYAKIKEWVTAQNLSIRRMRTDAYLQPNATKWVQCANYRSDCPITADDTRIIAMHVTRPETDIPKETLKGRLREEAPYFLRSLMSCNLPRHHGRLRLPVIETESKKYAAELSQSPFEAFFCEATVPAPGETIVLKKFNELFVPTLSDDDPKKWFRGATSADFANLATPVHVRKSNKDRLIEGVRWSDAYAALAV